MYRTIYQYTADPETMELTQAGHTPTLNEWTPAAIRWAHAVKDEYESPEGDHPGYEVYFLAVNEDDAGHNDGSIDQWTEWVEEEATLLRNTISAAF